METKEIALKVVKVMDSIKSISKDGYNSFHKYKYVTDSAIVAEIRNEMIANKLVCIPSQLGCTVAGDLTTLLVQYTLIDADSGQSIVSQVYGYGQDKGDKGVYKAATGAEKYFLLKTFLLPTDDDPENEKGDEEPEGYVNTLVRVPADYWKLKDIDPPAAQERIGAGNRPQKTPTGWFVYSPKAALKEFEASFPVKPNNVPPSPVLPPSSPIPEPSSEFITVQEQAELFRQVKLRNIHHNTFKKYLKDELGVEGTAKITKEQYPRCYTWIISHDSAEVGQ